MFVCPNCSEEIPNRVKDSSDECPFCHEPWPPEEIVEEAAVAEPVAAVAQPQSSGWGADFAQPATSDSAADIDDEPPKKSKAWIGIVVVVLIVGGGAGVFFMMQKGKKGGKKGPGGGGASGKVSDQEFSRAARWYVGARKVFTEYMAGCEEPHRVGYRFESHFVAKTIGGKTKLELDLRKGKGKPSGDLNIFECPAKLAEVHRDHPFILEMEIEKYKAGIFASARILATVDVKGKLSQVPAGEKRWRRMLWAYDFKEKGYKLARLKKSTVSGLKALSQPLTLKWTKGRSEFDWGGLIWKRTKRGLMFIGAWKMELKTNTLKEQLTNLGSGCTEAVTNRFEKVRPAPKSTHKLHSGIAKAAKELSVGFCEGLKKIGSGLEPYDSASVGAGKGKLNTAKEKWQAEVVDKLEKAAKDLGKKSAFKPL